jgi:hypothetical protein
MSNFRIGKRRYGIVWEYDGDGRFPQERWNKSDKRYWKRWLRRVGKEELRTEVDWLDEETILKIVGPKGFVGSSPTASAMNKDKAVEILKDVLWELQEHNADYHHRTKDEVLKELQQVIDAVRENKIE